jgi:hypothetical protein
MTDLGRVWYRSVKKKAPFQARLLAQVFNDEAGMVPKSLSFLAYAWFLIYERNMNDHGILDSTRSFHLLSLRNLACLFLQGIWQLS